MSDNAFVNVTRGSGREFVMVAVGVRELARRYAKVYCAAFNYEFIEALSKELDNVVPIKENEIPTFFNTYWSELNGNLDLYTEEPYNIGNFGMRKLSFVDAINYAWGLSDKKVSEGPTDALPCIDVPKDVSKAAKDFSKEHKKFVIVQFHGGQNPAGGQPEQPYNYDELGLKRHYPLDKAEELCAKLVKDGYEVLHYALPNEPRVKDAIYMQSVMPQLFYHELAKYAEGIITIDSSLMHLGIKHCKKMVVIWVHTSPISFGYKKAINIRKVSDDKIGGPSMNIVPLCPIVEYPSPEEVYECFKR